MREVKDMITIKNEKEIELMRKAGYLVSMTHKYLKPYIKSGVTTKELDKLGEEFIRKRMDEALQSGERLSFSDLDLEYQEYKESLDHKLR